MHTDSLTINSASHKPRIAITMGDPAGIGPEIICKALSRVELWEICIPVIFGDRDWMTHTAKSLSLPMRFSLMNTSSNSTHTPALFQATNVDLSLNELGKLSAEAGKAGVESVKSAVTAAISGKVDAVVTAPLNKEAIRLAGYSYPGHTELLAEMTNSPKYGMMLVSGNIRVVHVSTHVSLLEAISRVKTERILECIRLGNQACKKLGIAQPRIAVAGLNPHAGENGLFGREEIDEIVPAIVLAQEEGILASGPHSPDTIFARTAIGEFDLVIAQYHDQGHIPVKLHGFDSGVNVTIGLPIIRVSVDHGTAFDIAGKGIASEESLLEAIRVAVRIIHASL